MWFLSGGLKTLMGTSGGTRQPSNVASPNDPKRPTVERKVDPREMHGGGKGAKGKETRTVKRERPIVTSE